MSILNNLPKSFGVGKNRKRVGRGIGSGSGKTCGRGTKGQKSRAGVSIKGFEGGQNPIHMRLPKRGFRSHFKDDKFELTLFALQKFIDSGKLSAVNAIDSAVLKAAGIIKKDLKVSLIGNEGLKSKVNLAVARVSAGAKSVVESCGGVVNIMDAITK